jgi:hypothetical protein
VKCLCSYLQVIFYMLQNLTTWDFQL